MTGQRSTSQWYSEEVLAQRWAHWRVPLQSQLPGKWRLFILCSPASCIFCRFAASLLPWFVFVFDTRFGSTYGNPDSPRTHSAAQAGFILMIPLASASRMLGLQHVLTWSVCCMELPGKGNHRTVSAITDLHPKPKQALHRARGHLMNVPYLLRVILDLPRECFLMSPAVSYSR